MEWYKRDRYYIESSEGYTVCKIFCRDVVTYEAWAPRERKGARKKKTYEMLGHYRGEGALEKAKAACARDFELRRLDEAGPVSRPDV